MPVWVIAVVVGALVVVAVVVVAVVIARRSRHQAGQEARAAANPDGTMTCQRCGHTFTPPTVMVVTRDQVRRYGRDPVQCPGCNHIWNADRAHKVIRA